MKGIFDASALLNLANGEVLITILQIFDLTLFIGPQVRGECKSIATQLDGLIDGGQLNLLDDSSLPAADFIALIDKYGLGAGETECLTFARLGDHIVCCDDRRARTMIARELGLRRVIGSLGLLIEAIRCGLVTIDGAYAAYEQMLQRGGFLPEISVGEMRSAVEGTSIGKAG